ACLTAGHNQPEHKKADTPRPTRETIAVHAQKNIVLQPSTHKRQLTGNACPLCTYSKPTLATTSFFSRGFTSLQR
ncbi:MAG: hypothetical protein ACOH2R_22100, partial [Pseudomonas sp.]